MPNTIKRRHFSEEFENALGYSQVVQAGPFLFISGLTAAREDMTVAHAGNMEGQLREIYAALGQILAAYNLTLDNLVEEVVHTRSMDALMELTEVRKSFFKPGSYPASTALQIEKFALSDILLEIKFVAYAG